MKDSSDRDLWDWLNGIEPFGMFSRRNLIRGAALEQVHAMPSQGTSSTFKFGASFGALRMLCAVGGFPWREVSPVRWQRSLGLVFPKSEGLTKTQKKNRHKDMAAYLFPDAKITHTNCDALLLARYALDRGRE